MIYKQVPVTDPPPVNEFVPIIDKNGEYWIARWTGSGWNYRDLAGPNTPTDNNAEIVGWIAPATIKVYDEIGDSPAFDLPFLHKRNHDFLEKMPKATDFGYEEPNLYEEGGWTLEGGQEKYSEAIEKFWEENRCPECMILCGSQELTVFDGLCEDCASQVNEDEGHE